MNSWQPFLRCDQPSVRLACQIKLPSVQGPMAKRPYFLSGSPSTTSFVGNLTVGNILPFFAHNYPLYEHSTDLKSASMVQRFLDWL